jgi:hypothetical protein
VTPAIYVRELLALFPTSASGSLGLGARSGIAEALPPPPTCRQAEAGPDRGWLAGVPGGGEPDFGFSVHPYGSMHTGI